VGNARGRYEWRDAELCIGRLELVLVVEKLKVQSRLSRPPDMSEPVTQVKRSEAEAGNVSKGRNQRMSIRSLVKAYLHLAFQEGSEAFSESKSRRV
jgi:hypothetical protein